MSAPAGQARLARQSPLPVVTFPLGLALFALVVLAAPPATSKATSPAARPILAPAGTTTDTPTPYPSVSASATPGATFSPTPNATATEAVCDSMIRYYEDVRPSDWFYRYVRWAVCTDLMAGYSDGT